MNQWEREEQQLADDLASGLISLAEYSTNMRLLLRDMRDEAQAMAEDAAERTYKDALDSW